MTNSETANNDTIDNTAIKNKVIVLDLDDTLYSEMSYLKSAYQHIAKYLSEDNKALYELMLDKYNNHEDVFEFLTHNYDVSKAELLDMYRFHEPDIELYPGVQRFLEAHSDIAEIALVTDGRSKTQRNKIKALGLENVFKNIIISEEIGSEKPDKRNFDQAVLNTDGDLHFYIGDNISKDFITPNKMGWITICLKDQGHNIHEQDFSLAKEYLPTHRFESWSEIKRFFDKL